MAPQVLGLIHLILKKNIEINKKKLLLGAFNINIQIVINYNLATCLVNLDFKFEALLS